MLNEATPMEVGMKPRSFAIALLLLAAAMSVAFAAEAPSIDPAAKFIVNSNWQGTHEHKGHADPKASAARLKVTQRDGKTFKADFYLSNPRTGKRGVKVRGELDPKTGAVRMQPYEIISGAWGAGSDLLEEVWDGTIDGNKLEFSRKTKSGTWDVSLILKTKDEKEK
jgi:hypothetical protein